MKVKTPGWIRRDQQLLVTLSQSLADWRQIALAQQLGLLCCKLHIGPLSDLSHCTPDDALMDFCHVAPIVDDLVGFFHSH